MFKLVVLCAFLAAVVAEPGAIIAPLAYSTSIVSPGKTTITNQASSVIHPSPVVYSAPWAYSAPYAHLIKKRAVLSSAYIAPSAYIAQAPIATTYASPLTYTSYSPLATTYGAPIYSTAAHFIKKRSVPVVSTYSTYVAPTVYRTTPLLTSTYAQPIYSTPYVSAAPVTYTHLIKKRSAPLAVATYAAPAAYSHQSRVDINTAPAVATYSYSSPLTYASPFGFTRLY